MVLTGGQPAPYAAQTQLCGILAFASLIWEPGELSGLQKIGEVVSLTPWPVEFARSSQSRNWAPTLVRVEEGNCVRAHVMLFTDGAEQVRRALAKREVIDLERSPKGIAECEVEGVQARPIWYTALKPNIDDLRPECLARLAISSVKPAAERNGIRYLRGCLEHGIRTVLTEAYCAEVLRLSGCESLEKAERWAAR